MVTSKNSSSWKQRARTIARHCRRHLVILVGTVACVVIVVSLVDGPRQAPAGAESRGADAAGNDAALETALMQRHPATKSLHHPVRSTQIAAKSSEKRVYTVLYWNTFYDRRDFYVGFGGEPFRRCAYTNCRSTDDKREWATADALVFHLLNSWEPVPGRLQRQIYVFFLKESPALSFVNYTRYDGFFNATMTYRMDSDIVNPYFRVVAGAEQTRLPPIGDRTLPVAWIVSNCLTPGGREIYVDILREHIDVYTFGKCGQSKCPAGDRSLCYQKAAQHFHFYLSFENSQCEDYITEKFSLALKYGMVPVVMGPDKETYKRRAPPNSFIHIEDFEDPQSLAKHLHYLLSNSSAYKEYHSWRKSYHVEGPDGWCDMCRYLNQDRAAKVHRSLDKWWLSSCRYAPVIPDTTSSAAPRQLSDVHTTNTSIRMIDLM